MSLYYNIIKLNVLFLILINASCTTHSHKDQYLNTSSVNYDMEQNIKLIQIENYENSYMNLYDIKLSLNKKINTHLTKEDSLTVKKFIDSIVNTLMVKRETTISVYVFNETNYTNRVIHDKKGLLFCEFNPCLMNYGYNVNK